MTEATLDDIMGIICDYVGTPRTESEIVTHLEDMGFDRTLSSNCVLRAAGKGIITIAPGTCGKKLTTRARARAALNATEGEV